MQGILSTAQIEAAQEAISKAPSDADAAGNAHVGQRHLLAGLATAQRSLPAAELQRLQAIYARFSQAREGAALVPEMVGTRTMLA